MSLEDLCSMAERAILDHISFSQFVKQSENFGRRDGGLFDNNKSSEFDKIWFELEIVNSLALSNWEDEGCPADWVKQWNGLYKNDARELIDKVLLLLRG